MARGWESKSVESQMESAQSASPAGPGEDSKDKQGQQRARERQGLLLARADVLHKMESSSSERYTESLRKALANLDERIAALEPS